MDNKRQGQWARGKGQVKILIIKLSSIGDVVHTLPSLYAIRNSYPDAVIDWLIEEDAAEIVKGNNLLDECIVVRRKKWLKSPLSIDTWKDGLRICKILRNKKYDIVIDFQGLFKSSIWAFLSNGKRKIGFKNGRELSHIFLNEYLPAYDPDIHAVDRYLILAKYIGADISQVKFPLYISEDTRLKTLSILKENGIKENEPFILLSPYARWETKLWLKERFGDLCNMIMDRLKYKVVLTGSSSVFSDMEDIVKTTDGRAVNLAGATGLMELAEIINLSKLMITVDSGPMHVAAAIDKPVVALFGPTAPWRTGPYGKGHIVIRKELPCSPCFLKKCSDIKCMKEITVEDVLSAVEKQINAGARGKGQGASFG